MRTATTVRPRGAFLGTVNRMLVALQSVTGALRAASPEPSSTASVAPSPHAAGDGHSRAPRRVRVEPRDAAGGSMAVMAGSRGGSGTLRPEASAASTTTTAAARVSRGQENGVARAASARGAALTASSTAACIMARVSSSWSPPAGRASSGSKAQALASRSERPEARSIRVATRCAGKRRIHPSAPPTRTSAPVAPSKASPALLPSASILTRYTTTAAAGRRRNQRQHGRFERRLQLEAPAGPRHQGMDARGVGHLETSEGGGSQKDPIPRR